MKYLEAFLILAAAAVHAIQRTIVYLNKSKTETIFLKKTRSYKDSIKSQ